MRLKIILLFVITQAFALTILGQSPPCLSFHTGSYRVVDTLSGTTLIKRTVNEQFEKNDFLGYEVIFQLTWIDDCTYELRPKKLIKGDPAIMGDGNSFVRTKIKNMTSKGYVAETTASFSPEKIDFAVEKIFQKTTD